MDSGGSEFYSLTRRNSIIVATHSGGMSAEFFAKRGWQNQVDDFVMKANVLLARSGVDNYVPYSRESLAVSFSDIEPLPSDAFNSAREMITKFNQDYDVHEAKRNGMSQRAMEEYITLFPSKHPKLASYSDVNKIWAALTFKTTGTFDADEMRDDEQIVSDLKTLYSLLSNAEANNDRSTIDNFLKAVGEGFSNSPSVFA